MAKELILETLKALAFAAMLGVILVGFAVLAGCNPAKYEGDGFYNSGKPSRPVKCIEVRPRYTECRTV